MLDWFVAMALLACGLTAVLSATRYNKYLVSYDEPGSFMFLLFGRTGLRIFWLIIGLILMIAGVLVLAQDISNI